MENKPVSVIIPVYNGADFIAETLDSVMAQTYSNIEIIVIDDGSEDGTKEVVRDYVNRVEEGGLYQGKKRSLKLIDNTKKKGAAGARNTGIDEARGDYITFIDGDDKWLPEK